MKQEIVVAIVGTRHTVSEVEARALIAACMMALPDVPVRVISGGQTGVDTIARRFALDFGYEFTEFHEGDEVGPFAQRCRARNTKIANEADHLIALPCSHSRGTWMTVRLFNSAQKSKANREAAVHQMECVS